MQEFKCMRLNALSFHLFADLDARFPDAQLLSCFKIFDVQNYSAKGIELKDVIAFGHDAFKRLLIHFGKNSNGQAKIFNFGDSVATQKDAFLSKIPG